MRWGFALLVLIAGCFDNDDEGGRPRDVDARSDDMGGGDVDGAVPDAVVVVVDAAPPDAAAPGIVVTPTAGLTTTEAGGTGTFEVVLRTQPAGSVGFFLMSSDAGEVDVAPGSVVFAVTDWDVPVTVTVTGQPDGVVDGDQTVMVVLQVASSSDGDYDGQDPADVMVVNVDVD